MAAAEQLGEVRRQAGVDLVEGLLETGARLPVDLLDGVLEDVERLGQVRQLRVQIFLTLLLLGILVDGGHVDVAQAGDTLLGLG
jgi:hypothetical protein